MHPSHIQSYARTTDRTGARAAGLKRSAIELVRADVANLPLADGSVDAMHAGAALHSWPDLEGGLKEIRRSLAPGGRFFATTFLIGSYGVNFPTESGGGGSFRFFESEAELEGLFADAGFVDVDVRREGRGCAVIKAFAPVAEEEEAPEEAPAEAAAEEAVEVEVEVDSVPSFESTLEQME